MKRYNRLIFVDSDDTCRGPMAKNIMREKHLLNPLEIDSRGLVVLFSEPINQKAEAVLISNGYKSNEHKSQQLVQEDFGDDVLILAMEEQEKDKIWSNFDNVRNLYTLTEYLKINGDVPALYGASLQEYGICCEVIEQLICKLVIKLNEEAMGL
ncbi:MAG: phosphotyrosine protein phosphatase [Lachnospiraceae bacterium]|jgi:protein-tyrosine-phosphatase|nr:phosphotyrosine protein phosphatase [Lachnospiraceae bacterium]MDD3617231.1 phosphotyrosine protein phosphatase [Lachnospiraceae bacterium]